jgi:hypothetical protein
MWSKVKAIGTASTPRWEQPRYAAPGIAWSCPTTRLPRLQPQRVKFAQPAASGAAAGVETVPAGTGLVADAAGIAKEDLLPAPQLPAAIRKGQGGRIEWAPVTGAVAYRVTLYGAGVPLAETVIDDHGWTVDAQTGHYTLGIRAIAPSQLEGMDASTPLEVVLAGPSGLGALSTPADGARGLTRLRWNASASGPGPYTARIESAEEGLEEARDGVLEQVVDGAVVEVELDPGRYRWQVAGSTSDWSEPADFVVSPAPPTALIVTRSAREAPLAVHWQAPGHPVSHYRIRVLSGERLLVDRTVSGPRADIEAMSDQRCSPCTIQVSTRTGALESDYTAAEYRDPQGHPWPIYVALALVLIAL